MKPHQPLNTLHLTPAFSEKRQYNHLFFPLTMFISAALLFTMQPMAAKVLLPVFGGTPAVWTICMLFFQTLLVSGYTYAWRLSRLKSAISWRIIHLFIYLVSLCYLPIHLTPMLTGNEPTLIILKTLFIQMGLPILIISSSAPLLQYAFSLTNHEKSPDPYYLYVASNVGSLFALLGYPWIIERFIDTNEQFQLWNKIYVLYLILVFVLLITMRFNPLVVRRPSLTVKLATRDIASWIGLSFIPCSLMLGVTFYISTDIASTPLFWVVPLALYLLSFILTFSEKPLINQSWLIRNTPIAIVFIIINFIFGINIIPAWQTISFNLIGFFMVALLGHSKLFEMRPPAENLTSFYLCLGIGGMMGGVFNGLIAPQLFSRAYEYPIAILLALSCLPVTKQARQWLTPVVVLCLLSLAMLLRHFQWMQPLLKYHVLEVLALIFIMIRPGSKSCHLFAMGMLFAFLFLPQFNSTHIIAQHRNFYGIKRIFSQNNTHYLVSQSTLHGFQIQTGPEKTNGAIAYYAPVAPIIQLMEKRFHPLNATILGLGAGTLLCQFQESSHVHFVEIDEQVIQMATNSNLFTNLHDCKAAAQITQQDGRLAMTQLPDQSSQLLILDAFSSDAIPVHLLTIEAFSLYQKKLAHNGLIVVNVSNRYLNIVPVIIAAAHRLNLIMLYQNDPGNRRLGQLPSKWVLLTSNENLAFRILQLKGWTFVTEQKSILWTDHYSNIIPLININPILSQWAKHQY